MRKESREIPERREVAVDIESTGNTLTGLAVPYNSPSSPIRNDNGREFIETILPGAFAESLKSGRSAVENKPITFVWRHDDMSEFGSCEDNLKIWEDDKGIHFDLKLEDYHKTLKEAVASGKVQDMSFEFYALKDRWEGNKRFIEKGDLVHLSAVMQGAYADASVELRAKIVTTDENWKLKNYLLKKKLPHRTK